MPTVRVDDYDIFYDWIGEPSPARPTLVLLDGLASDSRSNRELFAPLADQFPMLMIDNSNRGQSTWRGSPTALHQQIREIKTVAETIGLANPVWHASSSRSALAYRLALSLPSAGLILESPIFSCGIEERLQLFKDLALYALEDESLWRYVQLLAFLVTGTTQLKSSRNFLRARHLRMRSLLTAEQLRVIISQSVMSELDVRDDIRTIECPTLIMRGQEEILEPEAVLRETVEGANIYDIRTFNTGHSVMIEAPDQVFASILEFMQHLTKKDKNLAAS